MFFAFFFFKQKTAYELRISDWSSDVCSSDLKGAVLGDALDCARRMVGPDLHTTAPAAAADQDAAGFEHLHCLTQYLAAYADPLRQVCLRTQPFLTTLAQAPGLVRQPACHEDRETTLAGRYRPRQLFPPRHGSQRTSETIERASCRERVCQYV